MCEAGGVNDRWSVVFAEARDVLAAQTRVVGDLDEKAIRSVRLTTILVSLLLAAIEFQAAQFHLVFLTASLLFLVASMVLSIVTYDESDHFVGLEDGLLEILATDIDEQAWQRELLETYTGMVSENEDIIRRNSHLFRISNASLISGIVLAVAAVLF